MLNGFQVPTAFPQSHVLNKQVGSAFTLRISVTNTGSVAGFANLLVGLLNFQPTQAIGASGPVSIPAGQTVVLNASGTTSSAWPQNVANQAEVLVLAGDSITSLGEVFSHPFTITVTPSGGGSSNIQADPNSLILS